MLESSTRRPWISKEILSSRYIFDLKMNVYPKSTKKRKFYNHKVLVEEEPKIVETRTSARDWRHP